MAIILDADVIIQGEKGLFDLRAWLSSYPDEPFEISAITVAELWHGLERASGSHRFKRQRYLDAVLETFPVAHLQNQIGRLPPWKVQSSLTDKRADHQPWVGGGFVAGPIPQKRWIAAHQ